MRAEIGPVPVARALRRQSSALWQTLFVLAVWFFLWSLHAENDGLWFQGDAPRHAANGFFWIDYLRDFTLDARAYALSYYARYPVIDPAARPPVFYLLEGAAFLALGPSPYVAKGLVLCFSLTAALYLMAWLRQWIAPETGWLAGLFLLLPGITQWSHAVMLNVPALAFGLGALCHARRWLEASGTPRRDAVLAAILAVLGILTYYPTAAVVFVVASWVVIRGDWRRWMNARTAALVGVCLLALLPFAWVVAHWAPMQLAWVVPRASMFDKMSTWTFYPKRLPDLFGLPLLCLAGTAAVCGLAQKRWRRETAIVTSWIVVLYLVLSLLSAKEARYAIPISAPLVVLCALGVLSLCSWVMGGVFRHPAAGRRMTMAVSLAMVAAQGVLAARSGIPAVSGYQELVSFVERVAPEEAVLYDGFYDGIFTFYLRAGDSGFRRRVALGNKVLYTYAIFPGWKQQDFVTSPEEVIRVLQERGGCRWLLVERSRRHPELAPMRHLRDAVETSAFELVRSFPIDAADVDRVDLYRFKLPVAETPVVELPFPVLGRDVKYRVSPIAPRVPKSQPRPD